MIRSLGLFQAVLGVFCTSWIIVTPSLVLGGVRQAIYLTLAGLFFAFDGWERWQGR